MMPTMPYLTFNAQNVCSGKLCKNEYLVVKTAFLSGGQEMTLLELFYNSCIKKNVQWFA